MTLIIIGISGLLTYLTRCFPFILLRKNSENNRIIKYLSKVLPPAIVGIMLIYTLKDTQLFSQGINIIEGKRVIVALSITLGFQVLKKNDLLSIGAGTIAYMILM